MKRRRADGKGTQGPEVILEVHGEPGEDWCREMGELLATLFPSAYLFEVEPENRRTA
jgi:hypothetical protein